MDRAFTNAPRSRWLVAELAPIDAHLSHVTLIKPDLMGIDRGRTLALMTADGRLLELDADRFLGVSANHRRLIAALGDNLRIFDLPSPFGPNDMPVPVPIADSGSIPNLVGTLAVSDDGGMLSDGVATYAVPSMNVVSTYHDGQPTRAGGLRARFDPRYGEEGGTVTLSDVWTNTSKQLTLPERAPYSYRMIPQHDFVLSPDGTKMAYSGTATWIASTKVEHPIWLKISGATLDAAGRGGIAFSADGSALCVSESQQVTIHSLTTPRPQIAGTVEIALPTSRGVSLEPPVCEIARIPILEGRAASTRTYPDPTTASGPGWIAVIYGTLPEDPKLPSTIELVIADPATGKLRSRTQVSQVPPGSKVVLSDWSVERVSSSRVEAVFDHGWPRVRVDVDTGEIVESEPLTPERYCILGSGALEPEAVCAARGASDGGQTR